ncbi:hypothetical protein KR018_005805 [Drosophila ironensis]|nr:hypothetical protein KR018_005805 [Drosophila ironensis]
MSPPKLKMFFYRCLLFAAIAPLVATKKFSLPYRDEMRAYLDECVLNNDPGKDPPIFRCFVKKLGIWSDSQGYNVQRIVDAYPYKHHKAKVRRIVSKCNTDKKTKNLDTWAYNAYLCSNVGYVLQWTSELRLDGRTMLRPLRRTVHL